MKRNLLLTALVLPLLLVAGMANGFPTRPITMLVPFAPGGDTDTTARIVAHYLGQKLGGTIVVVNRPGAGGELAMTELAHAAPDGYTISIVNMPGVVAIPIERNAKFNLTDFAILAGVGGSPQTMSVRGDSPIQNVQDLVKQAKANPGKLTIGTQGVASAGDFVAMSFESAAGAQLTRVPFTGAGPARNALLAGEINIVPASLAEALEFAKGTNWRILGQMAEKRAEAAPNVPTFKEQGLDIVWVNSRGFAAPKATPPDVLEKYRQGFADLFKDTEFIAKANAANQQLVYVTGQDFRKDLDDLDKMLRSLRQKGIWK